MLQRVVMLAAESLKVLEHQLMDGSQTQDVRVGTKPLIASNHSPLHCPLIYIFSCICAGGHAPPLGGLRRVDPPEPKAGPPARPGSRPPGCQLQQRRRLWFRRSDRGGSARHRLQPRGSLFGRAQSESEGCWKGACGVDNVDDE